MTNRQLSFSPSWRRTLGQAGSTPTELANEQRALLNTIRYAEGTWIGEQLGGGDPKTGSPQGFNVIQGYGRFSDTSKHPGILGPLSDAAGAYQIISPTDEGASRLVGTTDFSPVAQDNKALALARERMLRAGLGGLSYLNKNGLDDKVIASLTNEWASFPGNNYGQPTKKADDLKRFYTEQMKLLQGDQATSTTDTASSTSTATPTQTSTPSTTEVVYRTNEDGSQTVTAPGAQINVTLTDGDKKSNNFLEDYIAKAAWSGLFKDMTGGIDINKIANTKLYPTAEELLA
jgi:muramidase (phage lysozyme)